MAAQAAAILRSKRKRYEIELLLSPRTEIIYVMSILSMDLKEFYRNIRILLP